jgi:[protein-PII] uridylyltransferase
MAETVALRLGLAAQEAALVGWLVQQHALLSDTAFKRDLDEPETIAQFVALVQSPQRLRLLLLLTVADIKAVGPTIFNGWKGALMRTLYYRAMAQMGVGATYREGDDDSAALIAQWQEHPHVPAIAISHDGFRDVTVVGICLATAPRLFTALTGVLSALGASIVSARIRQLAQASYCEFHIQDAHGHAFAEDAKRLKQLPALIGEALQGGTAAAKKLAARRVVPRRKGPPMEVRTGVFIDNGVSHSASVVEVNARDRVGLLVALLRAMDDCGLQVMTAHINTYGQLAVDVFYVKDSYGHKLNHQAKQAQLRDALRAAIETENV